MTKLRTAEPAVTLQRREYAQQAQTLYNNHGGLPFADVDAVELQRHGVTLLELKP